MKKERSEDIVLFHGGCHGCTQQKIHGVDWCYNCMYFDGEWTKPDLNNKRQSEVDIIREEIKKKHEVI